MPVVRWPQDATLNQHFSLFGCGFLAILDLAVPVAFQPRRDKSPFGGRPVAEADAVWCTNWNDISATDIAAVSDDSYNAVMITEDPSFTMGAQAYENIDPTYSRVGCSVE